MFSGQTEAREGATLEIGWRVYRPRVVAVLAGFNDRIAHRQFQWRSSDQITFSGQKNLVPSGYQLGFTGFLSDPNRKDVFSTDVWR